jgi:peptide/nickel transport system permease protein
MSSLTTYLFRRILQAVPVVFFISTTVFFLIHLIPGDPVDVILGDQALPADREAFRKTLGLHLPIWEQYLVYLRDLFFSFDLGESLYSRKPVTDLIAERILPTLLLALSALAFALVIALPSGILAALKRKSFWDRFVTFFTLIGIAMPSFWLGPLLILFFSIRLGLFPVSEMSGIKSFVLPTLTLGLALAAITSRMTRTSLTEVLDQDYIRTAESKGLQRKRVILKHALRNALIPIITIVGLQAGALLSGAIITETIFDWPGLGTLIYDGIQSRDYPVVQGCVLMIAFTYVGINILTDIVYAFVNPQIRLG